MFQNCDYMYLGTQGASRCSKRHKTDTKDTKEKLFLLSDDQHYVKVEIYCKSILPNKQSKLLVVYRARSCYNNCHPIPEEVERDLTAEELHATWFVSLGILGSTSL